MADAPDELYGAPLDEFVGRRDALARALRKDGRRDDAEEVKTLRKPSVAAWVVNMLARQERRQVEDLLEAGERLREAHAKLLAGDGGGGRDAVQKAVAAERAAVEGLVGAARGILADAGRPAGDALLDRVRDTLHAAAADERVRGLVRAGTLVEDEEATGFALAGLSPGKPARRPSARAARPDPGKKRAEQARRAAEDRAAKARAELAAAERSVKDAERALARAEKEAQRHRTALDRAERALERG